MKILIVSQCFWPDSFRVNDIAAELVRRGHEVTVLTGLPDYATGKVPGEYRFFRKRREDYLGAKIKRVPIIARRKGALWRALNYGSFMLHSWLWARFTRADFDVIYSYQTSPITQCAAARSLAKRRKKPWFLYCLDLWPESLRAWNVGYESALFTVMKKYSYKIYNAASRIGISSSSFNNYLQKTHNISAQKILYLPQHAASTTPPGTARRPSSGGELSLTYAGNIGAAQDMPTLLSAAASLPGVTFDIFGSGSELESSKALAKKLNANNIIFHGRVDKKTLEQHYQKAGGFLLTLADMGAISGTVPAKLQEYMSAGKPVFAACPPAAAELIREADCGRAVPSGDHRKLAEEIRKFAENPVAYSQLGQNGLKYYEKHFTLEIFMERLLRELEDLTQ
ncbi:MAG: glycosyltransferase family 4 protein [Clostridia bacterium]|nr:glycosyltransferase family 4 protein [Clostridia bacterium]